MRNYTWGCYLHVFFAAITGAGGLAMLSYGVYALPPRQPATYLGPVQTGGQTEAEYTAMLMGTTEFRLVIAGLTCFGACILCTCCLCCNQDRFVRVQHTPLRRPRVLPELPMPVIQGVSPAPIGYRAAAV